MEVTCSNGEYRVYILPPLPIRPRFVSLQQLLVFLVHINFRARPALSGQWVNKQWVSSGMYDDTILDIFEKAP